MTIKKNNQSNTAKATDQSNDDVKTNNQANAASKASPAKTTQTGQPASKTQQKNNPQSTNKNPAKKGVNQPAMDEKKEPISNKPKLGQEQSKEPVANQSKLDQEQPKKQLEDKEIKKEFIVQKEKTPPKKSSGLVIFSFLLGAAGTGLGAFAVNQHLNQKPVDLTEINQKISALSQEVEASKANTDLDQLQKELTALTTQVDGLSKPEGNQNDLSEQLAVLEQTQKGLIVQVDGLSKPENNQDDASEQLAALEQTQKGLITEIDQKIAAVTQKNQEQLADFQKQLKDLAENKTSANNQVVSNPVKVDSPKADLTAFNSVLSVAQTGALLQLADYQLKSGMNISATIKLLSLAIDQLKSVDYQGSVALSEAIRNKMLQLQGITPFDSEKAISNIQKASQSVADLEAKQKEVSVEGNTVPKTQGYMDKALSAIKSGIKYTPNDPSQIDLSAESLLVQKRLLQIDFKILELAIVAKDKSMLLERCQAIETNVQSNFAETEASTAILKTINNLKVSDLNPKIPDLSSLISGYQKLKSENQK